MGLDLCHVLSEERHYGDFVCLICQQVVDLEALVTIPCSHCFCKLCLEEWLGRTTNNQYYAEPSRTPNCPTCSRDLLYCHSTSKYASMMIGPQTVTVQPLQSNQPLAYRVLKKINVCCPFGSKVGCNWNGDYGDLTEHMLSKTAHENYTSLGSEGERYQPNVSEGNSKTLSSNEGGNGILQGRERQIALATSFKEEGNQQFASGHVRDAQELYTKALNALTDEKDEKLTATLYSNRAATQLHLERFSDCVRDCSKALELDPSYLKAYTRKGKALIQLGHFQRAADLWLEATPKCDESAQNMIKKEASKAESLVELMAEGEEALAESSYAKAKAAFGRALRKTSAGSVIIGAARADLGLGLTESVMRLSLQIIKASGQHVAEGYEVRSACLFLMGDFDGGRKLINEALRQAPDMVSAQKLRKKCSKVAEMVKQARDHSFHRRFDNSVEIYTRAIDELQSLPAKSALFGILYTERAESYLRLKQFERTLKECSLVLYAQEDYKHASLIKVQALHGLGRPEAAMSDADALLKRWGSNDDEIRRAHNKADFEVRKMKREDFYKALGVSPIASEREIKAAYSHTSRDCHPDRFVGDQVSDDARKAASKRYRLLGDALELLCDDFKRQLYDEGYDQEAIKERVERAKRQAKSL